MEGFQINYTDIYDLFWEYKTNLENLMNKIDTCENCINFFIKNAVFTGETGDAVKSYLTDVHIIMLSSIRVTAQNLLDNMTLYKAGYYDIDNSTNFKLSEEAIRAFRTKLSTNYSDTESYTGKIQGAVSGISDISGVGTPSTNGVLELHEQLDQELLNLITEVQSHESSTVTALENSVELLLSSLNTCIAKIGLNTAAIASYESNSFYTDKDVYALANISELFYQQHEDNKDVYDAICEAEQNLKDAAEERETQGVWKTVAGVVLVGVGVACIIATAGAGAQKYTTDLTGNQTAGMIAGMAASMATAKGLNGIEAGAKKLAKPKLGDVGTDGGAVLNDADVGSAVNGGTSSKIGYEYLDDQLGNLKDKVKINQYQSAESVNAWWEARGYKSPYKEKTVVQDITLTEDTKFVRVYDGVNSNLEGGWVMRAEDIKGLTPKEIQAKFALEYEPKFIGEVELKAGDTVRLGEVGPNFGFDGGGIQIDLQQQWIGDFTELGKIEDWR